MSGDIPLLPTYAFMAWTGTIPFLFRILLLIDFDPPRPLPPLIPRNIKLVHRGFTDV
jgi:hypothetical protein